MIDKRNKKNSGGPAELVSLMSIIGRRMREEMRQNPNKNTCSLLHFEALGYVRDNGKPLMRDVANYFMITPPAATLLIDGMVANGLLTRIVDKNDRRAVRISLTVKGKNILKHGIQERMQKIKEVFSVLTEKERIELARMLTKITKRK